jgi:nitrogen fixation/metabolism regulation signal transduction histidine kinase
MNQKNKTMTMEGFNKETEIRLINFFNNAIEPEEMAKLIRQVNHILSLSIMRKDETLHCEIINLGIGFYWLNRLAEALDPYLDVE